MKYVGYAMIVLSAVLLHAQFGDTASIPALIGMVGGAFVGRDW